MNVSACGTPVQHTAGWLAHRGLQFWAGAAVGRRRSAMQQSHLLLLLHPDGLEFVLGLLLELNLMLGLPLQLERAAR